MTFFFYSLRCDRILSFGKGIRQLRYKRAELILSDHRPVSALYMIDVEIFSPRKLQRALTFTTAEIENDGIIAEMGVGGGINCLSITEVSHKLKSQKTPVFIFSNKYGH